jgi:pimeloyl-ACP methyl ester carboxylesterase
MRRMRRLGAITGKRELVEVRRVVYARERFARSMRQIVCQQDPVVRGRNLVTGAELAAITAPTMVIWTSDDPSGPAAAGLDMVEKLREAPRRTVRTNRGCRSLAAVGWAVTRRPADHATSWIGPYWVGSSDHRPSK